MSNGADTTSGSRGQPDLVEQLMRAAGRREPPPAGAYERALEASLAAYQRKLISRRRRRAVRALAASLVLAAVIGAIVTNLPGPEPAPLGRLERVAGLVEAGSAAQGWSPLTDGGARLATGTGVRTSPGGRAAIGLPRGVSLRLDGVTEVVLESATQVRLVTGRLYVDTGPGQQPSRLTVISAAGAATDLGTQFEVLDAAGVYRLRVREGVVRFSGQAADLTAGAESELRIDRAGHVAQARIARDDPAWEWAGTVAPVPELDGQPLSMLLDWVERETGRSIVFAEPGLETRAATTILHGNIDKLSPLETLWVMLSATDFGYRVLPDGSIELGLREQAAESP